MKKLVHFAIVTISCFASSLSFAAQTFAEIERSWQQSKIQLGYVEYQNEFIQYNNYLHLDVKNGCYRLAPGKFIMYLVINAHGVVESVVTDTENIKTECFKQTYHNLSVKVPPFSPFVIQMRMEDVDHKVISNPRRPD